MKVDNSLGPRDQPLNERTSILSSISRPTILLIVAFVVYALYWTILSLLKFFYFQATIFDLGVSMQSLWNVTHSNWTLNGLSLQLAYQGIVFLLFPIQYGGFVALLIFQTIFLDLGSIALYFIGKKSKLSKSEALLISVSYLLYFPLSGLNWFDFHFQSLFVTLFLFGYLLYIEKRYLASSIIFFISGLVRFPYAVFPLIFWFYTIFLSWRNDLDKRSRNAAIANTLLYLVFISLSFLRLQNAYIQTHFTGTSDPMLDIGVKALTILAIFGPVLFIPLFSRKWLPFFVPFVVLMIIANNPIYEFPYLFRLQYSASFIAFIFLGLMDVHSHRKEFHPILRLKKLFSAPTMDNARNLQVSGIRHLRIVATIFIICLLMTSIYQYILPVTEFKNSNIGANSVVQLNRVELNNFYSVANLIPSSNPFVLIQNNLPQFLPGAAGNNLRVAGYIGPQITQSEIISNNFPWVYLSFSGTTKIDYIVVDLNSSKWFQNTLTPGFPTLANMTTTLLGSGMYGILGQAGPFLAIERGYTGKPEVYSPMVVRMHDNPIRLINGSLQEMVLNSSSTGTIVRFSNVFALPPGLYSIRVHLVNGSGEGTSCTFGMLGSDYFGSVPDVFTVFNTGILAGRTNTFNFTAHTIISNLQFFIQSNSSLTSEEISSLYVSQSSPYQS